MKSLEEFVALFAEQFEDTDPSEITASTAFRDLDEWSSLIGLSVIAMVDEEFDVVWFVRAEGSKPIGPETGAEFSVPLATGAFPYLTFSSSMRSCSSRLSNSLLVLKIFPIPLLLKTLLKTLSPWGTKFSRYLNNCIRKTAG